MKQYKILFESVTGKNSNVFTQGSTVDENRFEPNTITELIAHKAIEEVITKSEKLTSNAKV